MFEQFDRFRAVWAGVGLALALVLAWVTVTFLGTVIFGVFLYYATRPAHRRIEPNVGQPTVSALLALLALALPVVLLVAYTGAIALQELSLLAESVDLGPYESAIDPYLNVSTAVDNPQTALDNVGDPQAALDVLQAVLSYLGLVGSGLLSLFIAFSIAFYLLRDADRLAGYGALVADDRGTLEAYGRAVDRSLSSIYFGTILNAFLTGVIAAITYSLLNLMAPQGLAIPFPALVGVLAGAGSLIPVVGMKIVYVPLVLYLGGRAVLDGTGLQFVAIVAVVSIVVVDLIPDFVLRPFVSGRGLHTGTVMFAFVLGPVLFGWYGLFLGPLLLVLIAHFVRLVLPELLAGDRPKSDHVEPEPTDGESETATDAAESRPSETGATDTSENGDTDTDQHAHPEADSEADS
ncbi:AI-2E family transporter [Salinibaculum salinum]|uniref:AI-2E family transporter n=1 Tax=Salinibaculum salinum TaxID=3131996 RepID=UPI0030ED109C